MFVIETMMADGPHWYRGIVTKDASNAKLIGPGWSPYFSDAKIFIDAAEAKEHLKKHCKEQEAAYIVGTDSSKIPEGRWGYNGHWYMMAKYCPVGMQIGVNNIAGPFQVTERKERYILVKQGTREVRINHKDNMWIEILGKGADKTINDEASSN